MLTRRDFLARFGGLAAATAAVCALPQVLGVHGWWSAAYGLADDIVLDTYNGLAAMVWPGDDLYSMAQGESNGRPGAIAANAGRHTMAALDGLVPQPPPGLQGGRGTVPLSGSVASALNTAALAVNPAAAGGGFPSPFARLPFADKAAVWRSLEEDTRRVTEHDASHSLGVFQYVFGILPGYMQLLAFSEVDVFDPAAQVVSRRPVGWDHCGYLGDRTELVQGCAEFTGYYRGRTEVER